jgi:branched-chain amino acid transport system permease protein
LFTFLGGATFFFGPVLGGILMVLAFVLLSELTKAWLLYLGLIFLFMVVYAPGGFAALIMVNLRIIKAGAFARLLSGYVGLLASGLLMLAGASALIEMVYHMQLNAALSSQLVFAGVTLDTHDSSHWLVGSALLLAGLAMFEWQRQRFMQVWEQVQSELAARSSTGSHA